MNHPSARGLLGLVLLVALPASAAAQAGEGGTPPSLTHALAVEVPVELMPVLDTAALLAEDAAAEGKIAPFRFGIGHDVALGLETAGVWEDLPNGERLWRVRIASPGAHSLNLIFDRFALPVGARLFVHNDAGRVLGAFTSALNQPHGMFATEPLSGDALTIEYVEPQSAPLGELRLSKVVHAYRDILGPQPKARPDDVDASAPGSLKSGFCNININCPLGANWQDEKRSSARLVIGGLVCSGALINNTAQDGRQYFLTANHCYGGNPATWIFQFNYESTTCNNGPGTPQSVSGSVLRSKSTQADHCLVEITQAIPSSYNVYYSGWTRSNTASTTSTGIHHPGGDIKKICQDTDSLTPAIFGGTPCWRVASWEQGVTEGGSSGSPLYDQNKRIVGQLYGGQASCSFLFNDYYGRFGVSWNNGMSNWLDPLGTNPVTLDGTYPGSTTPQIYCTAKVTSQGLTPTIGFTGTPSLALNNFSLFTLAGIPGSNGIVFWGPSKQASPFNGGTLCVAPPINRGPVQQFDPFGLMVSPIPITANMVGTTLFYQYWGRDPAHPDGTGVYLSDAVEVPFVN